MSPLEIMVQLFHFDRTLEQIRNQDAYVALAQTFPELAALLGEKVKPLSGDAVGLYRRLDEMAKAFRTIDGDATLNAAARRAAKQPAIIAFRAEMTRMLENDPRITRIPAGAFSAGVLNLVGTWIEIPAEVNALDPGRTAAWTHETYQNLIPSLTSRARTLDFVEAAYVRSPNLETIEKLEERAGGNIVSYLTTQLPLSLATHQPGDMTSPAGLAYRRGVAGNLGGALMDLRGVLAGEFNWADQGEKGLLDIALKESGLYLTRDGKPLAQANDAKGQEENSLGAMKLGAKVTDEEKFANAVHREGLLWFHDFVNRMRKLAWFDTRVRVRMIQRAIRQAGRDSSLTRTERSAVKAALRVMLEAHRRTIREKRQIADRYELGGEDRAIYSFFAGYDVDHAAWSIPGEEIPQVFPVVPAPGQVRLHGGLPARVPPTDEFATYGVGALSSQTVPPYRDEAQVVMPASQAVWLNVADAGHEAAQALQEMSGDPDLFDEDFGFRDSANLDTGVVSDIYVADNKAIIVDIANAVTGGKVQKAFEEHPSIRTAITYLRGLELKQATEAGTLPLERKEIDAAQKTHLISIAKKEWAWWEAVTADPGAPGALRLPPDHSAHGVTHRADYVGNTALGFYALAIVSAKELGIITEAEAVRRIQHLVDEIALFPATPDGLITQWHNPVTHARTNDEPTNPRHLESAIDLGWMLAALMTAQQAAAGWKAARAGGAPTADIDQIDSDVNALLTRMNLSKVYDTSKHQFMVSFDPATGKQFGKNFYGTFASEILPAVLVAIGKGDLPAAEAPAAWKALSTAMVRLRLRDESGRTLPVQTPGSHGGSALERNYPHKIINPANSPNGMLRMAEADRAVVRAHATTRSEVRHPARKPAVRSEMRKPEVAAAWIEAVDRTSQVRLRQLTDSLLKEAAHLEIDLAARLAEFTGDSAVIDSLGVKAPSSTAVQNGRILVEYDPQVHSLEFLQDLSASRPSDLVKVTVLVDSAEMKSRLTAELTGLGIDVELKPVAEYLESLAAEGEYARANFVQVLTDSVLGDDDLPWMHSALLGAAPLSEGTVLILGRTPVVEKSQRISLVRILQAVVAAARAEAQVSASA
jgi:hypothetical protein